MDAAEAGKAGSQQQQPGAASTSGAGAAVPFGRSASRLGALGAESFDGALRELKDLRAQLHEAADCCEKAFLKTEKKKLKNDQEVLKITGPTLSGAGLTLKPYDVQPSIGKEDTMASASFDDSSRNLRRSFSFRAEDVHIILGDDHKKKTNTGSNILSFLKKN
ncbi:putative protein ABIL5 [Panicum miliaceum]|uniref:Uncharacterized protein n=1 Tax=Panicum miliaceum TaxID=4540 RepID=A0A3L6QZQ3_PANMI|nr:putative protein ABIL5 [Panicum miliaceum]